MSDYYNGEISRADFVDALEGLRGSVVMQPAIFWDAEHGDFWVRSELTPDNGPLVNVMQYSELENWGNPDEMEPEDFQSIADAGAFDDVVEIIHQWLANAADHA